MSGDQTMKKPARNLFTAAYAKVKEQFAHLERRQRLLVLFLVASILFSVYYNAIHKPQEARLRKMRTEMRSTLTRLEKLKLQMPDVEKARAALAGDLAFTDSLKKQILALEAELPTSGSVPRLLGELVRQASGYGVDFISIKPKATKDKESYGTLTIEIKCAGSFPDLVNYIHRLEGVSRFLNVIEASVEGIAASAGTETVATVLIRTLLRESETGLAETEAKEAPLAEALPLERNPFVSSASPAYGAAKKETLKLSGIIAGGKQPTAIINDEVYRVGDQIERKKVTQILPNMVILSDGKQKTVLTLDRER